MVNFKKLVIWNESLLLTKEIYKLSADFPRDEKYGLTSQIRRAVVSIPSNISEGSSRKSRKEFSHFLDIALGSSYELKTQLTIAQELGILKISETSVILDKLNKIQASISSYNKKLLLDSGKGKLN
ncbi:MAG: four helix bundle protein [Bacteroidetes bacterium]|nr:four helix bundle protein [Bacteroidota bacterium]